MASAKNKIARSRERRANLKAVNKSLVGRGAVPSRHSNQPSTVSLWMMGRMMFDRVPKRFLPPDVK